MKTSKATQTFEYNKKLSENKYLEVQLTKWDYWFDVFRFSVHWSIRGNHAGLGFGITFFMFAFYFDVYDCRHWDYELNQWE